MASRLEKVAQEIFEKSFQDLTPNQQEFTRLQNTLELRKKYAEKQYGVEIDYELEKPDRITKPFLKRKRKEMGRNREKFIEEYGEEKEPSWQQKLYNVIENISAELLNYPDFIELCKTIVAQLRGFMENYADELEANEFINSYENNKAYLITLYPPIKYWDSNDLTGTRNLLNAEDLMMTLFNGNTSYFDMAELDMARQADALRLLNEYASYGNYRRATD